MEDRVRIVHRPSPNHNARPVGVAIDTIVLHGTGGASEEGDLAWLRDKAKDRNGKIYDTSLSYHYLVGRAGTIYMLVKEEHRAWHAGKSSFYGRQDVNDFSIGVAFANKGPDRSLYKPGEKYPEPYTTEQYDAGAWLCADIWIRRDIGFDRMPEHRAVSPRRKTDPWDHFDLHRFFVAVANYRFPPPDPIELKAA